MLYYAVLLYCNAIVNCISLKDELEIKSTVPLY